MATNSKRIVGFSTVDIAPGSTDFSLYNQDIAIRDLLNTFRTPKGSRVMLPEFGSNIYYYEFENLNSSMVDDITNDAKAVVEYDTRFTMTAINVTQEEHGVTVAMDLIYNPSGAAVSLAVDFQNKTQENL